MAEHDPDATTPTPIPVPAETAGALVPASVARDQRGRMLPGHAPLRGAAVRKVERTLASAVRDNMPPQLFVDFFAAIAMGKSARLAKADDGSYFVTWDERGSVEPTNEQRIQAMRTLEVRAHGQAPQSIQLEADIKNNAGSSGIPTGLFSPAMVIAMSKVFELRRATALPATIDVPDSEPEGLANAPQALTSDE